MKVWFDAEADYLEVQFREGAQWGQCSRSISNTRFSSQAQLMRQAPREGLGWGDPLRCE
ncbi:MAG: hypothetical protein ACREU8_08705 [Gammaproteobacteria bacterium]